MEAWRSVLFAVLASALVFAAASALLFGQLTSAPTQRSLRARPATAPVGWERSSLLQQQAARRRQAAEAVARLPHKESAGRECADAHADCAAWAQAGDCASDPGSLLELCRQSCGVCEHYDRPQQKLRRAVQLNNGRLMPLLGFGTAGLGPQTYEAVLTALEVGYRLFDTAQAPEWYREAEVGAALAAGAADRSALFLTTKLHPRHFGEAAARVNASLAALRTSYLDLLLLHYPICWPGICSPAEAAAAGSWQSAWHMLEPLVAAGCIRALGVSNFGAGELAELLAAARVRPAVVQARSDPLDANVPLQAFCARSGVQFQGYSTLGAQWLAQGAARNPVLASPVVGEVAAAHNCSPAQAVLRWALQHRQAIIPRSARREHMAANLEVLEAVDPLSLREMRALDALDGGAL